MDKMTSYERISRMFEHKEADRVKSRDYEELDLYIINNLLG